LERVYFWSILTNIVISREKYVEDRFKTKFNLNEEE